MDENKSKMVIIDACYLENIESKSAHIVVYTSKVKNANNETRDEEPLVTDNSVITAPSYFKVFECAKNFLNKIDATCEQACMEI